MKENGRGYKLNYENLIDMFPCALYVIRDSVIIDCNSAAVTMFGFQTKEEVIGLKPHELSPERQPDGSLSLEKGREIIEHAVNNEKGTAFKWMHKRKNGDVFWADIRIYNKNGNLYAVMTDINETEQLKQELSRKEHLYSMVFEKSNTVKLLIDPETGQIIEANNAAVKYYGYSKEQLLNMKMEDINTLDAEQVKKEMLRAKLQKRNHFEFIHRLANGEQREVEVYSFPVELEEKVLLFSIINDVADKLHNELMFNTLFFNSPYAVVILDKERKIVKVNENFTRIFQYQPEEVKGKCINQLLSPSENRSGMENNLELVYRGEIVRQEGVRKRKDGSLIDVEIMGFPVVSRQLIIGVYAVYNDISRKKADEEQLLLFRKILENISEGVVITDTNAYIEWTNNAFKDITGYSPEEVKGSNMNILKSGIQDREFYQDMWQQLASCGAWSGEVWNKTKKGEIYSEWLTISSIKDNAGKTTHYVGIFKDLSEKKKIDRRINDLEQRDILTGLYNRSYFLRLVETYIKNSKSSEQFSVIFIDIEDFKEINNSLGHHIGDKLLVRLAERLQRLMNEHSVLARYSGDEFAVLCKHLSAKDDVSRTAKAMLESIKQPFNIGSTALNITVNIGISIFPDNGRDAETLLRHAETAIFKAKGQLEERICFYSGEMSKEIEERFLMVNLLVDAVRHDEFSVYYQPIFDIRRPDMVGAEALLRWNNAILGQVSPAKFIPLAEKTGQIIRIGEWVLEQVCRQINLWQCSGYRAVPVSVNISVKQLEQAGFAQRVIEIIKRHNVAPSSIELEITESVSSGDLAVILKNIQELKKYGIKISMDDFGIGFSSLGQLARLELDKLKIDKIFIDDLTVSKRQKLVKSIIAMARSLDLTVVAEGIETNRQLVCLQELGCQLGQGYLFSKPLPPKEIEVLFKSKKP